MKEIDIGEMSEKLGISTATIRFYESKGLIKPIGYHGLRRQYSEHSMHIILLVKLLKNGGMSLKEIHDIFINQHKIVIDRDLIDEKLIKLNDQIHNLQKLMTILRHVQACPYQNHMNCPSFIKLISID